MSEAPAAPRPKKTNLLFRVATWLATFGCFYVVYLRTEGAAAQEGLSVIEYLVRFFSEANWLAWIALMIPYSVFFFLVDSHVTWRVVRWFNAPDLRFTDMLPIRASAYILSLVNEQVGKGAMSLYLFRRYRVPAWEAISSMLLLGIMEIYQLLLFSSVGVISGYGVVQAASRQIPLDIILPSVFVAACVYLPLHIAYFRGHLLARFRLREQPIVKAFREARPVNYLLIVLFKAPNLIGAIVVYTVALELFNVDVSFAEMLAFLPVIFLAAALPLPFHAGALLLWTVLFPDFPEVGAFSLVMHTFFVLFNAVIGVMFLPQANKELFGGSPDPEAVQHGGEGGQHQQPRQGVD
jgi:hypothetical protein